MRRAGVPVRLWPEPRLRERVRRPRHGELLRALEYCPPVYLVGGAVRDLLLGRVAVDLDLAVEGDARRAARELAAALGGDAREHERFGTATVAPGAAPSTWPPPAARPTTSPGRCRGPARPAGRGPGPARFTINAMAIGLSGDDLAISTTRAAARRTWRAGLVRVLARAQLPGRPDAPAPGRALRGAAGIRPGGGHRADGARGGGRGRARHRLRRRVRNELMDMLGELDAPAGRQAHARPRHRPRRWIRHSNPIRSWWPRRRWGRWPSGPTARWPPWPPCAPARRRARPVARLAAARGPRPRRRVPGVAGGRAAGPPAARRRPDALRAARLLAGEPPEPLALALAFGAPAPPILRWVSGSPTCA